VRENTFKMQQKLRNKIPGKKEIKGE